MVSVYVLISDIEAVADYARLMHQRNLLTTGDYVIISIEDEVVYSPEKQENYFLQAFESCLNTATNPVTSKTDGLTTAIIGGGGNESDLREVCDYDSKMLFPFKAVFIVTPSAPIDPDYDQFKRRVNCRNRRHPFNVPIHELIDPDVSAINI